MVKYELLLRAKKGLVSGGIEVAEILIPLRTSVGSIKPSVVLFERQRDDNQGSGVVLCGHLKASTVLYGLTWSYNVVAKPQKKISVKNRIL